MTTIAYHHESKTIAVDSRTTCGSLIASDSANKVDVIDGVKFIGCGLPFDIKELSRLYPNGSCEDLNFNATVYVVDNGKVFRMGQSVEDGFWIDECTFNRAEGSGQAYAVAAMDFGCDAKGAVEYAMTRDVYTGGKVKVVKVK